MGSLVQVGGGTSRSATPIYSRACCERDKGLAGLDAKNKSPAGFGWAFVANQAGGWVKIPRPRGLVLELLTLAIPISQRGKRPRSRVGATPGDNPLSSIPPMKLFQTTQYS